MSDLRAPGGEATSGGVSAGEFPRMLHHPDGSRQVVSDGASRDRLLSEGWLLSRYVPVEPAAPTADDVPVEVVDDLDPPIVEHKKRGRPRKS